MLPFFPTGHIIAYPNIWIEKTKIKGQEEKKIKVYPDRRYSAIKIEGKRLKG